MTKLGCILLLLSCIFISLGFESIFQNKIVLEGNKGRRRRRRIRRRIRNTQSAAPPQSAPTIQSAPPPQTTPVTQSAPATQIAPTLTPKEKFINAFNASMNANYKLYLANQNKNNVASASTNFNNAQTKLKSSALDLVSKSNPSDFNNTTKEMINIILNKNNGPKNKLSKMKNFIIAPFDSLTIKPIILNDLNTILDNSNMTDGTKITEIQKLINTI